MATFLNDGFWAYPARKNRLFDIVDTIECFLDNNSELWKSTIKENIFQKVYSMVFGQEMAIFLNGGFSANPASKHRFLMS